MGLIEEPLTYVLCTEFVSSSVLPCKHLILIRLSDNNIFLSKRPVKTSLPFLSRRLWY